MMYPLHPPRAQTPSWPQGSDCALPGTLRSEGPSPPPGPRGPSRRTSMSTLEMSCAAMSRQPSSSAAAGTSASEYQFRFTVCA